MTVKIREKLNILNFSLILAVFLRIYSLGDKSLWQDEQWTHVISSRSFLGIFKYLKAMTDRPPLHLILTKLALFFGSSEFIIRLVPAIFGILSVYLIYVLGKIFFSKKEGSIAALILSTSFYHINYSQEATTYTVFLTFSLLSIIFMYKALSSNKLINWVLFVLFTSLNFYSSYFSCFLLFAMDLFVFTIWASTSFGKLKDTKFSNKLNITNKVFFKFIFANLAILLLFSPWLPIMYSTFTKYKGSGQTSWITVDYYFFKKILTDFNQNKGNLLFLILFLTGFIKTFKKDIKLSIFIFWIIASPFLIIFILKPKYHFFSRYIIYTLPIIILVISRAVIYISTKLKKRFLINESVSKTFIILSVFAFTFGPLVHYYNYDKRDWRSVSNFFENNISNKDLVIIEPGYLYWPFFYYLPIDQEQKLKLVDPLTSANLKTINLNGKNLSVGHFMHIMKPGVLKNYKNIWYVLSVGKSPDWVLKKFEFIKKFNGLNPSWDISVYKANSKDL